MSVIQPLVSICSKPGEIPPRIRCDTLSPLYLPPMLNNLPLKKQGHPTRPGGAALPPPRRRARYGYGSWKHGCTSAQVRQDQPRKALARKFPLAYNTPPPAAAQTAGQDSSWARCAVAVHPCARKSGPGILARGYPPSRASREALPTKPTCWRLLCVTGREWRAQQR